MYFNGTLTQKYGAEYVPPKKSVKDDRLRYNKHLKSVIGHLKVAAMQREFVASTADRILASVRGDHPGLRARHDSWPRAARATRCPNGQPLPTVGLEVRWGTMRMTAKTSYLEHLWERNCTPQEWTIVDRWGQTWTRRTGKSDDIRLSSRLDQTHARLRQEVSPFRSGLRTD